MAFGRPQEEIAREALQLVERWQAFLSSGQPLFGATVEKLRTDGDATARHAKKLQLGGLSKHLGELSVALAATAPDRSVVKGAVKRLSQICWQLDQEIRRGGPSMGEPEPPPVVSRWGPPLQGAAEAGSAAAGAEPAMPPLLNRSLAAERGALGQAQSAAPPPAISHDAPHPEPHRAKPPSVPAESSGPQAARVESPGPSVHFTSEASGPLPAQQPPAEPAPSRRAEAPPARVQAPPPVAPPHPPPQVKKPNLMVATMFGLRAFGNKKAEAPRRGSSRGSASSRRQPVGPGGSRSLPEDSLAPSPRGASGGGLLGLGKGHIAGRRPGPRAVAVGPGGLHDLAESRTGGRDVDGELERRLGRNARRSSTTGPRAGQAKPAMEDSLLGVGGSVAASSPWGSVSPESEPPARPVRRARSSAGVPWWWGIALLAVVALGVVAVIVVGRIRRPDVADGIGIDTSKPPMELPSSKLLNSEERLRSLLAEVHSSGGEESPELADLIDEEAALVRQVLAKRCKENPDTCDMAVPSVAGTLRAGAGAHLVRHLFRDVKVEDGSGRPSHLPPWLSGLNIPAIGVEPHPKVKHWIEYFTENPNGRERFQSFLFRCGEFFEPIEQVLIKYSLPKSILGLVITESGCVPDILSPAGARGLWQFMPATARAYHLRVKDGVVDERISPPKATDAAARFLSDLKRKMGSWELTFASYNMGPFGVAARIRRAGGKATYWQLADADLLPDETANYVPRIQAYATILANLEHYGFSTTQQARPIATSDLEAPTGTRLGQVARAAGTSIKMIQKLNPDIVGPSVPAVPGPPFLLQVPRDIVFRARENLEDLLASGDEADLCVSREFDWGTQRFTAKMAERCRNAP